MAYLISRDVSEKGVIDKGNAVVGNSESIASVENNTKRDGEECVFK